MMAPFLFVAPVGWVSRRRNPPTSLNKRISMGAGGGDADRVRLDGRRQFQARLVCRASGGAADAGPRRRLDHQHVIDRLDARRAGAAGLRRSQGCDRRLHQLAGPLGRPDRIRVNAIAPGMAITERQRRLRYPDEQVITEMRSRQAVPDAVTPEDIANMALFLASDDSQRITGQCFRVDGRLA